MVKKGISCNLERYLYYLTTYQGCKKNFPVMIQFEYSLLFLDVPLVVVLTTFDEEAVFAPGNLL